MHYEIVGDLKAPALVCVPGLLGGPEDFRSIIGAFENILCVIILDPNRERREKGLSNLTAQVMQEVSFSSTANDIRSVLDITKHEKAYLLGISLGGKIVYDFAIKFPKSLLGAVVTDVGHGSFEESELYRFVDQIVKETNLNLTWPELKIDLQMRIKDRSLRSLIQSQVSYPNQKTPGVWKTGMQQFRKMLERQSIDNQFKDFQSVDSILAEQKCNIHVLQSQHYSGISADSIPMMQQLKCIKMHSISESSHFIHITHKSAIQNIVLEMIKMNS